MGCLKYPATVRLAYYVQHSVVVYVNCAPWLCVHAHVVARIYSPYSPVSRKLNEYPTTSQKSPQGVCHLGFRDAPSPSCHKCPETVHMTRHVQGVKVGYVIHAPWRFVRAHGGDHIVVNRSVTLQGYSVSVRTSHHVQGSEVGGVKLRSAAVHTRSRRQSHSRQTRRHPAVASGVPTGRIPSLTPAWACGTTPPGWGAWGG